MTRERDRIQENANKYIVRNCPAIQQGTCEKYGMCQDCTDCLIKQIYEMCKSQKESYYSFTVAFLADRISRLFNIEEINK